MALVSVTIVPLGTTTPSVSKYVAGVEKVLRASGLKHELNGMGTIIEGELDAILSVIRKMHEQPFIDGVMRVSTLIRIDDRRDKEGSIEAKVRSVKEKLGE